MKLVGPGSVYAQHLTHFSNLRRKEFPRTSFLSDLVEDINSWENKEYQIIIIGDINEYSISRKIKSFASKLGVQELIID